MNSTLFIEDISLTEISELPQNLKHLTVKNTPLTLLPELPHSLIELYIDNVPIVELPELPESLKILKIYNTKITKIPKINRNLLYLEAPNNQITEFPKNIKHLININVQNNNIKKFPSFFLKSKETTFRIENNPGSLQYYNVYNIDKDNISFVNDKTQILSVKEIPVLTLKKGTVLFHNIEEIKNIYDMYLGLEIGNSYVMNPNTQVYFMPHPFHTVSYGSITTICVLKNDVKVVLGINPSKINLQAITDWYRYFGYEHCNEEMSLIKSRYPCPNHDIIKNNIMGWIGSHSYPFSIIEHGESNNFMKYYKYVSYYKDIEGVLDRPEIMIHPYKKRLTQDVITPKSEAFEDGDKTWLDKNEHKFNYKIIEIIDDNQKFKKYKRTIDNLLSKEGHNGYHMFRNKKDGFYMIREFM